MKKILIITTSFIKKTKLSLVSIFGKDLAKVGKKISQVSQPVIRVVMKPVHYYFKPQQRTRFSMRILGVMLVAAGVVAGSYITLSRVVIPWVRALTESTHTMPSDTAFNATGYDDGSGTVAVLSSEVRIATSSAWLNGSYLAKKTITLNNLSGQELPA